MGGSGGGGKQGLICSKFALFEHLNLSLNLKIKFDGLPYTLAQDFPVTYHISLPLQIEHLCSTGGFGKGCDWQPLPLLPKHLSRLSSAHL